MIKNKLFFAGIVLITAFVIKICCPVVAYSKNTIVVEEIEDQTNRYYYNIGKTVLDMLITELNNSGEFIVLERSNEQLNKIKERQAECLTGFVNSSKCPKIGEAYGTEFQLFGSITELRVGENTSGNFFNRVNNLETNQKTAYIKIDIRITNSTYTNFVTTVTGEGNKSETDGSLEIEHDNEAFRFKTTNYKGEQSLVLAAARAAVEDIVKKIKQNIGESQIQHEMSSTGYIKHIDGRFVYINIGSKSGIKKETKMEIFRQKDIYDDRGTTFYKDRDRIGTIIIVDVQMKSSKGKIVENTDSIRLNDMVRVIDDNY